MLRNFLKEHWVLVFALALLVMMSLPLLYFGNLILGQNSQLEKARFRFVQHPPDIGICLNSLMESKWIKEKDIWLSNSRQQGTVLQIKVAHYSLARQIEQMRSLIQQKVKVIIVVPVSRFGLADVLEEARREGIRIIFYEEMADGPADLYVGVDGYRIGKMQADTLTAVAGAGNYLIFRGPKDSYQAEQLYRGQMEVMQRQPQSKVLAVETLANWSAEDAVYKTRASITHQKLAAILAPRDDIAAEIAKFLREQKMPLPYLTGYGGDGPAYRRIKSGDQLLTVSVDYQAMAQAVLTDALTFIRSEKVTSPQTIVWNGRKLPCQYFPVYLVDKNNLEVFLNR